MFILAQFRFTMFQNTTVIKVAKQKKENIKKVAKQDEEKVLISLNNKDIIIKG